MDKNLEKQVMDLIRSDKTGEIAKIYILNMFLEKYFSMLDRTITKEFTRLRKHLTNENKKMCNCGNKN